MPTYAYNNIRHHLKFHKCKNTATATDISPPAAALTIPTATTATSIAAVAAVSFASSSTDAIAVADTAAVATTLTFPLQLPQPSA
jgi:hypothetical protein